MKTPVLFIALFSSIVVYADDTDTRDIDSLRLATAQPNLDCLPESSRPLREIPAGGITKWTDEKGITHYEDYHGTEAPSGKELVTRFPDTRDYFTLELNSDLASHLTHPIKTQLKTRILNIYDLYAGMIDKSLLHRATVNLYVYQNEPDFIAHRERFLPKYIQDVPGFFTPFNNQAVVLYRSREETLDIATHESVHVINQQLFGDIPRWLNEGLAIAISDKVDPVPVSLNKDPLHRRSMAAILLNEVSVNGLINSTTEDWLSQKRKFYYPLSGLLAEYLLRPENSPFNRALMKELISKPCDPVNLPLFIDKHYRGGQAGLEKDFIAWLGIDS